MSDNLIDSIFGPLNSNYCLWFYLITALFSINMAGYFVVGVIYLLFQNKKMGMFFILLSFLYCVMYFQNRLLYSMCVRKNNLKPFA